MAWFKHWFGTRYYSLLYGHRDEQEAADWVQAILHHWDLPRGSEVLDLACGRGRHVRHFAAAGMKVSGVDISEASIREAKARVPEASFVVHDMRETFVHEGFDAMVCLFTSLGYFDTKEDDRLVFGAAYAGLRPGGRFVLDFMNTAAVLRNLVREETVMRDGIRFHITRDLENSTIVKRILVTEHGSTQRFEERVLALRPDELDDMAQEAGFLVEGRTDGPELLPFDPIHSRRYVLWLRKQI
jgi:SAM-dependent methyltransferase